MRYAIETHLLSKAYRDVRAVANVTLRVRPGEIYGFVGLNGAGKTTTIRLLLGMIRPSAGSVRVLGLQVGPYGIGPWARVGHMAGSPSAYPQLTVRENLEIARRLRDLRDVHAADRVVQLFALGPYADRKAGTLSSGKTCSDWAWRAPYCTNLSLSSWMSPQTGLTPLAWSRSGNYSVLCRGRRAQPSSCPATSSPKWIALRPASASSTGAA